MNRPYKNIFLVFIPGLTAALPIFLYNFFVRAWVRGIPEDSAPSWFIRGVEMAYPRFKTEKHRLPIDFFLEKADQVMFRYSLVVLLVIGFIYLYYSNKVFFQKFQTFWDQKASQLSIKRLQKIYAVITCYLVWDWILILNKLSPLVGLYEPVFLLRIFRLEFPSVYTYSFLYGGLILSLILLFLNRWVVWSASFAALSFILIQGYFFSFHKIDHTYATYNYAVLGMPLLLHQAQLSNKRDQRFVAAWPLLLIQLGVATAYLMAGIEKLWIGKIRWFYPETLIFYLQQHESILYSFVNQYPMLATWLSMLVVVFEIAFIGILFLPKYRIFFLACGVLFHLSTYFFLGVGGLLSPWIMVYVFFIPWEEFSLNLKK